MRILILDVYPDRPYRVTKGSNGGFGTANDFGDGVVTRVLRRVVSSGLNWPPLFSAYTASVLRAAGHDVFYERQYSHGSYDLCLVPSSIVAHETELDAIRQVKAKGIPVGAIGPFATAVSEPYTGAGAFVVAGEPEMYFHRFTQSTAEIRHLRGICNITRSIPLDDLPYPAWDLIFEKYPARMAFLGRSQSVVPIIGTRGCPYSCFQYCTYPLQQGSRVRARSPDSILSEMIHWKETLGISNFIFRDPVFSINRRHTITLCDQIEKSGERFRFAAETHLNNIDAELGRRLYAAGLRLLYVGIESASPDVLQQAGRRAIPMDEVRERIRLLEREGIRLKTMYMIALPLDSRKSFEATLGYARRLRTAFAQFSVFTPYPGTPVFEEYKDQLTVDSFEKFTQWHLVFQHDNFSAQEVRHLLNRAYRSYYTNPLWIAKFLRQMAFR